MGPHSLGVVFFSNGWDDFDIQPWGAPPFPLALPPWLAFLAEAKHPAAGQTSARCLPEASGISGTLGQLTWYMSHLVIPPSRNPLMMVGYLYIYIYIVLYTYKVHHITVMIKDSHHPLYIVL